MDIMVGRYICQLSPVSIVDFGNYIDGNISGYKLDSKEIDFLVGTSPRIIYSYVPFANITNASGY